MVIFQIILFCIPFDFGTIHDIPYRDPSTYKLSLKMEFKTEPTESNDKVDMVYRKKNNSGPQLYLNASIELLKLLEDDYKIKIFKNNNGLLISKKLKSPDTLLFKLGYAEKIKSGESPSKFTIQFINKAKKITSQIILEIKENGDFIVNGKQFGKV